METTLLIDGNNLLFQMFYGMPSPIYNRSGRSIHGTIGFISFLIKEILLMEATEALVVFDSDSDEGRKELLPQYKENRNYGKEEELPFSQEDDIRKALDHMGVHYIYSKGTEADDTIAYIARKEEKKGKRVVISSFDSDFFQCISENISVLRYRGKNSVMWDKMHFLSFFGFSPSHYPLYKALLGDASDNIPGVSGYGKKRAAIMTKTIEEGNEPSLAPLPRKVIEAYEEEKHIIGRNLSLIKFREEVEVEDLPSFSFDMDRVREGNTAVLTKAGIFD